MNMVNMVLIMTQVCLGRVNSTCCAEGDQSLPPHHVLHRDLAPEHPTPGVRVPPEPSRSLSRWLGALGALLSPFLFWLGGKPPTKIDCQKKGSLILVSLLEDLDGPRVRKALKSGRANGDVKGSLSSKEAS